MRVTEYKRGRQTRLDVQFTAHTRDAEPQDDSVHPGHQTVPFDA